MAPAATAVVRVVVAVAGETETVATATAVKVVSSAMVSVTIAALTERAAAPAVAALSLTGYLTEPATTASPAAVAGLRVGTTEPVPFRPPPPDINSRRC